MVGKCLGRVKGFSPERTGHDIADVGQAEQHQWNSENGVEDGRHLPVRRLRGYVAITFNYKERRTVCYSWLRAKKGQQ